MKIQSAMLFISLWAIPAFADPVPPPEFEQSKFLLSNIEELNVDYALVWTDSIASLFVDPFDVVVLHLDVEGEMKDVFVISDAGQNRVAFFQCSSGAEGDREIEKMGVYRGEDVGGLREPSGMTTSAIGREFEAGSDVIYLADMSNDRILELVYLPNEEGGEMYCNRILAEGVVEYPIDIAIATDPYWPSDVGLVVIDQGHEEDAGSLLIFTLDDVCIGIWEEFPIPEYPEITRYLDRPVSVACFPDEDGGCMAIFISEEATNSVFRFAYDPYSGPILVWEQLLELGGSYWKPGGIAFDDYGRIYVTNEISGRIELFGRFFECEYGRFGEQGEGPGQFMLPSNIVIDTYYGFCEALILEWYGRQSGFQTYIISNGASGTSLNLGFKPVNLVKPLVRQGSAIPENYSLGNAYPNPFNSMCRISFDVPEKTHVKMDIFNILGQRVTTLVDEVKEPGSYSVRFSAAALSSGVYFYFLQTGQFQDSKSVVLLK